MTSRRSILPLIVCVALALSASRAGASSFTVVATGSGSCGTASCDNDDPNEVGDHYATHYDNNEGLEFRNWFAFDIPNIGAITSATLNIFSLDANNSYAYDPDGQFDLYEASGPISFASLVNGASLGSIGAVAAHPVVSGYVTITLNALALSLLNSSQGDQFLFGGEVTAADEEYGEYFGWGGHSDAPYLELSTDTLAEVPEPASLMLMGVGLAGVGAAARRRRT